MIIRINADLIDSWNSFHQVFKFTLGFPDFYGANMDAWIDCMTHIDDPTSGMTSFTVKPNETVMLALVNSEKLKNSNQDIYYALLDCVAFVNRRKIEEKSRTYIAVASL